MRPICRGRAPRKFKHYHEAIGDLEERLGTYCSYCERRLPTSLAVEHVVPKSRNRKLRTKWTNFLLGCPNCNSAKKAKRTNGRDFLWPDKDNTLRAFTYSDGGVVEVSKTLRNGAASKAEKLQRLVGLHRHPVHKNKKDKPAPRDLRWNQRDDVWTLALRQRNFLARSDTAEMREATVAVATGYGFFSVWMTVFERDRDMRKRLFRAFKGTARNCFNSRWRAINRPGGRT
jgi:uncharacterized protein (TIGR02646 family)